MVLAVATDGLYVTGSFMGTVISISAGAANGDLCRQGFRKWISRKI